MRKRLGARRHLWLGCDHASNGQGDQKTKCPYRSGVQEASGDWALDVDAGIVGRVGGFVVERFARGVDRLCHLACEYRAVCFEWGG